VTDIWGRIFLDAWRGEAHPHSFHRDDGNVGIAESAANYFEGPRSAAERAALERLSGRVLDLATGAGRYALFLQERGCDVVAVDSSPGAIQVCRKRGCRDARVVGIDDVDRRLGTFDAIVCMGNTFGVDSDPASMPDRLRRMAAILEPNGTLVVSLIDPLATSDPEHLGYHARNRAAGRPPGLARMRVGYRGEYGDWQELWMPTPVEFEAATREAGWRVAASVSAGNSYVYAANREER
jgi:SAM-dependent methyltransferase